MRTITALLVFFLTSWGHAIGYTDVLARAGERPPVQSARSELADAEAQWKRLQNDPEALRLDRLKARQRIALARARLRLEEVRAAAEISRAYTQVLDAESAYELAWLGLELADRNLEIARLRYVKGGISRQELRDAELRSADAASALRKAGEARSLARTQLTSLVGNIVRFQDLEPPGEPLVPSLDSVYLSLNEHPDRLRMRQNVELAETALAMLDPSYAPRAQIDAAKLQLAQARDGLREVVRGIELQAKSRWQTVAERRRTRDLARQRLQKAERDLEIALERYRSGLISEIALLQVRFARAQSALDAQTAAYAYLNAAWDLAVAIAQPLEVRDAQ